MGCRSIKYFTAVYWFVFGMFINVGNDIISKYIKLHFFEITFFRFLFASIVLIPVIFYKDRKILFSNISIHLTRGIILFLATTSWTYGLSGIHLTAATAISSSIPLIILVLSVIFLQERIVWQRWLAVLLGFAGIIITLNPGSDEFDTKIVILLFSAVLFAILDTINKKIVCKKSILIMLLYSSVVVTALSFIPMVVYWIPPCFLELFLLMILGINSNLILFCILKAFLLVDISALATYRYLELLISYIASYLIFDQLPQNSILYGGIIIVSSIIFIIKSEYKN
jgi:S-adenosylmethionine uptake transporter